ncbi:RluA family pseudouridine synthase [Chloroflexota bacterium]
MDKVYSLVVDKTGVRLDRYIGEKCPELSRTYAQKLISDGYVTVNERVSKAGIKLSAWDRLKIVVPPPSSSPLLPESIPLNIIYEDDDVLVIDKPAGLVVYPAPGHPSHTLVNAVLAHFPHLADISDSVRPGIVHRLDKETSGVMMVAKNSVAQLDLVNQFKNRSVVKTYQVLVKGHLIPYSGIIEASIGRDPRNRQRMAVVTRGREAHTEYRVVRYLGDYTLLEIGLKTGRTHQIRVHLTAIGYPVVGDSTYGVKSPYVSRQFVHAARLGFKLPSSGEYVEFTSELPPDLEQALKAIA